ncbi:hypothetical protein SCLCIDRAFT_130430, partial [Scleroderma citrinum Foug A]
EFESDAEFHAFCCHVLHTCLSIAFEPMKSSMSKPEVTLCADGHYQRAIYGLGPYIGDYPEQALLTCIVQGWCPKCTAHRKKLDRKDDVCPCHHTHTKVLLDTFSSKVLWKEYGIFDDILVTNIHELIAPDILHQIIKGTFKDHIVSWVESYIE